MNTIRSQILREFYFESPQSIALLSQKIGKSVPLTTKEVQQLLAKGLLKDMGLAQSNGGRRANLFSLNYDNLPHILLIVINQKEVVLNIYNFANQPIQESQTHPINLQKGPKAITELLQAIKSYLANYQQNKLAAISVTTPGFVNTELGLNTSFPEGDARREIRRILEDQLNLPTFIENDSTAIAIAEHKFGKARNANDVLVINLSWGVGLGMILDKKLFKGSSGFAGEFSHIPLSTLNKLCSCGKRGCLEVEASLEAVIAYALAKIERGEISALNDKVTSDNTLAIQDVLYAAHQGDQLAIEAFGAIAYALGKGIATLIHIINPEKIIISGFGVEIGSILMPQIQSALLEYSIQRLSEKTNIEISDLHNVPHIGAMATAVANMDWKIVIQYIKH